MAMDFFSPVTAFLAGIAKLERALYQLITSRSGDSWGRRGRSCRPLSFSRNIL